MTRPGSPPQPDELDTAERISREDLLALPLERLQATLATAHAKVPHYRASFDAAGVARADCRSPGDLAAFPLTTKLEHDGRGRAAPSVGWRDGPASQRRRGTR